MFPPETKDQESFMAMSTLGRMPSMSNAFADNQADSSSPSTFGGYGFLQTLHSLALPPNNDTYLTGVAC